MRRILLIAALLTAACAHNRAPIYGYGRTTELAAAQCRAQHASPSADTTRAADGGVQMRCRR